MCTKNYIAMMYVELHEEETGAEPLGRGGAEGKFCAGGGAEGRRNKQHVHDKNLGPDKNLGLGVATTPSSATPRAGSRTTPIVILLRRIGQAPVERCVPEVLQPIKRSGLIG